MLLGHSIKPKHGARRTSAAVGRGHGSGLGTTAGRGQKGQRARSGGRHKLAYFGSKSLIQSMPKLRGFKSQYSKTTTVTLDQLQRTFADGTIVTKAELLKVKLLIGARKGARIVGNTKLEKKFTVEGIPTTAGAKASIEAAGGSVK